MIRIGINGYGRIGRNLHRMLIGHPHLRVTQINTRAEPEMRAHLLKYDSLHGALDLDVWTEGSELCIGQERVKNTSDAERGEIPWSQGKVDIVLESTGRVKTYQQASEHRGVQRVLVSAPMKDDAPTYVMGVNEERLSPEISILNNASCTTNCVAPALCVLLEKTQIENVFVTSIHSYTSSQNLLDNSGKDKRRARSTTENIIPTTTGSIAALGKIFPQIQGRVDGLAFRVPTPTVSICDVRLVLGTGGWTPDSLNQIFREAAKTERYRRILGVCDEELVSADFRSDTRSLILDTSLTKVLDGKYAQIQLWYDNEWGYASRLVDLLEIMSSQISDV